MLKREHCENDRHQWRGSAQERNNYNYIDPDGVARFHDVAGNPGRINGTAQRDCPTSNTTSNQYATNDELYRPRAQEDSHHQGWSMTCDDGEDDQSKGYYETANYSIKWFSGCNTPIVRFSSDEAHVQHQTQSTIHEDMEDDQSKGYYETADCGVKWTSGSDTPEIRFSTNVGHNQGTMRSEEVNRQDETSSSVISGRTPVAIPVAGEHAHAPILSTIPESVPAVPEYISQILERQERRQEQFFRLFERSIQRTSDGWWRNCAPNGSSGTSIEEVQQELREVRDSPPTPLPTDTLPPLFDEMRTVPNVIQCSTQSKADPNHDDYSSITGTLNESVTAAKHHVSAKAAGCLIAQMEVNTSAGEHWKRLPDCVKSDKDEVSSISGTFSSSIKAGKASDTRWRAQLDMEDECSSVSDTLCQDSKVKEFYVPLTGRHRGLDPPCKGEATPALSSPNDPPGCRLQVDEPAEVHGCTQDSGDEKEECKDIIGDQTSGDRYEDDEEAKEEKTVGKGPVDRKYTVDTVDCFQDPQNEMCADCYATPTDHVNATIGTFVCALCADVHKRILSHWVFCFKDRLTFSGLELAIMENASNMDANEAYLMFYDPESEPMGLLVQDSTTGQRLDFLEKKYITRAWHNDSSAFAGAGAAKSGSAFAAFDGHVDDRTLAGDGAAKSTSSFDGQNHHVDGLASAGDDAVKSGPPFAVKDGQKNQANDPASAGDGEAKSGSSFVEKEGKTHHVDGPTSAGDGEAKSGSSFDENDVRNHDVNGPASAADDDAAESRSSFAENGGHNHLVDGRSSAEDDAAKSGSSFAVNDGQNHHVDDPAAAESKSGSSFVENDEHNHDVDGPALEADADAAMSGSSFVEKDVHNHDVNGPASAADDDAAESGSSLTENGGHNHHVDGRSSAEDDAAKSGSSFAVNDGQNHHVDDPAAAESKSGSSFVDKDVHNRDVDGPASAAEDDAAESGCSVVEDDVQNHVVKGSALGGNDVAKSRSSFSTDDGQNHPALVNIGGRDREWNGRWTRTRAQRRSLLYSSRAQRGDSLRVGAIHFGGRDRGSFDADAFDAETPPNDETYEAFDAEVLPEAVPSSDLMAVIQDLQSRMDKIDNQQQREPIQVATVIKEEDKSKRRRRVRRGSGGGGGRCEIM